MKYIKSFDTESDYNAGKSELSFPYVAYTKDDEQVHYARSLEDLYDIVGTLVPGTESFTFTANGKTITPTIIGDRFVYNWTGGTISAYTFSFRTSLLSIDKFEAPFDTNINTNNAFNSCSNLKQPFFYSGQTIIGGSEFSNCTGMTGSLTIPNSVTSIDGNAFYNCSGFNGSLTIPDSVTSIGNSAFNGCIGFTGTLTIPNSVTSISGEAFRSCGGLTSVTIHNSVTSIGQYAFYGCRSLTSVTCLATTPPTLGSNAFGKNYNWPIYVPSASVADYQAASEWSTYASRIQAIP